MTPSHMVHSFWVFKPIYSNKIQHMFSSRNLQSSPQRNMKTPTNDKFCSKSIKEKGEWIPSTCHSKSVCFWLWSYFHQKFSSSPEHYLGHPGANFPKMKTSQFHLQVLLPKLQFSKISWKDLVELLTNTHHHGELLHAQHKFVIVIPLNWIGYCKQLPVLFTSFSRPIWYAWKVL